MASPYTTLRVYRYATAYRVSFAGLHSASELSAAADLLAHRRTAQAVCGSPSRWDFFSRWKGSSVHSRSRQIEAEQGDAIQACLDEQPIAKAALGTKAQGTAKPWIRRRSSEYSP